MRVTPRFVLALAAAFPFAAASARAQPAKDYGIHDRTRPLPPVVTPGDSCAQQTPAPPPSDARRALRRQGPLEAGSRAEGRQPRGLEGRERLLRGREGHGRHRDRAGLRRLPAPHRVDGAEPAGRRRTRTAATAASSSMGIYEVQVLDSYQNETYPDGQAGALYGQYPPLVNAVPAAGRVADLRHRLRRAALRPDGKLLAAGAGHRLPQRRAGPGRAGAAGPDDAQGPHALHGARGQAADLRCRTTAHPVRFRNVWIRELAE